MRHCLWLFSWRVSAVIKRRFQIEQQENDVVKTAQHCSDPELTIT